MQESIRLGTIGRTRIGLNWSVVFVAVLIAFSLATGELPAAAPGFHATAYWAIAVVTAIIFFASLLGHELSHAVTARRRGVAVDSIVLWALGGLAKLNGEAPDAEAELRIAIAGPIASLALAGAFGLAALGLDRLGISALVIAALVWLAEMNGLLGLFNLLPAYPLDGGRVLRAGLWRHWHDRLRATETAAEVGRTAGAGLVVFGIATWFFFPTFPLSGLWLALVGWFVFGASRQEALVTRTTAALEGFCAKDAMTPIAELAPSYVTLEDLVARYIEPHHVECCPLVAFNGEPAGLVTLEQLNSVRREDFHVTRAGDVAWPSDSLAVAAPDAPLVTVMEQLSSVPSRCALVVEDGRLIGTLTASNLERIMRSPASYRRHDPTVQSMQST